ncbi:hypothetical protein M231_06726 [Tremella mesenterica]|uniref:Uncharacterized protein n=1 Tax=Tremella mesenterica TaxID=5217 RepID=A0A4Q1BB42_TREME|nr:hypothetical protein M231_06726 [Tremella mesenterica]
MTSAIDGSSIEVEAGPSSSQTYGSSSVGDVGNQPKLSTDEEAHSLMVVPSTGLEFYHYRRALFLSSKPYPSPSETPPPHYFVPTPPPPLPSKSTSPSPFSPITPPSDQSFDSDVHLSSWSGPQNLGISVNLAKPLESDIIPSPMTKPEISNILPSFSDQPPSLETLRKRKHQAFVRKLERLLNMNTPKEREAAWRGGVGTVYRNLSAGKTLTVGLKLGLVVKILKASWIRDGTWPIDPETSLPIPVPESEDEPEPPLPLTSSFTAPISSENVHQNTSDHLSQSPHIISPLDSHIPLQTGRVRLTDKSRSRWDLSQPLVHRSEPNEEEDKWEDE